MATHRTNPQRARPPVEVPTTTVERDPRVAKRWRGRRAERKRARLVSARNRRVLARWLRRTAKHAVDPDPIRRRHDVLLHYRAAAVRTDLLEIAAMLEHAHNPNPACLAALHDLLADGDSPLYNANIHVSELRATLNYVRSGLVTQRPVTSDSPAGPRQHAASARD
jgi:hypothetical protein